MLAFLGQTWFLWWLFAVMAILRWFHNIAADVSEDITAYEDDNNDGSRAARPELQSVSS
jgi:carbonic anhydrase